MLAAKKVYFADKTNKIAKKKFKDTKEAFQKAKIIRNRRKAMKTATKKASQVVKFKDTKKAMLAAKKVYFADKTNKIAKKKFTDTKEAFQMAKLIRDRRQAMKTAKEVYSADNTNQIAKKTFLDSQKSFEGMKKEAHLKLGSDFIFFPKDDYKNPPTTRLYIGNLSKTITEDQVREFFQSVGKVKDVLLMNDPKMCRKRRSGFVSFGTQEEADKAITMSESDCFGQPILIVYSKKKKKREKSKYQSNTVAVYLCNVPEENTIKLKDFFKDCGEITNIRYLTDGNTGVFRGSALVEFKNPVESLDLAVAKNGKPFLGCPISVDYATPLKKSRPPGSISVFVHNLTKEVETMDLKIFFEDCGKVTDIRYCTNYAGKFKGCAFVEFADDFDTALDLAVAKNNKPFLGRFIHVEYADPPKNVKQIANKSFRPNFYAPEIAPGQKIAPDQNAYQTSPKKSLPPKKLLPVKECFVPKKSLPPKKFLPHHKKISTVFVANLPQAVTTIELGNFFKDCGKMSDVRYLTTKENNFEGCALIEFVNPAESLDLAVIKSGEKFLGKRIHVTYSASNIEPDKISRPLPLEPPRRQLAGARKKRKLPGAVSVFVGNVHARAQDIDFKEFFKNCGKIRNITYLTKTHNGEFLGSVFIEFIDPAKSLDLAVAQSGNFLLGQRIGISYADPHGIKNIATPYNKPKGRKNITNPNSNKNKSKDYLSSRRNTASQTNDFREYKNEKKTFKIVGRLIFENDVDFEKIPGIFSLDFHKNCLEN